MQNLVVFSAIDGTSGVAVVDKRFVPKVSAMDWESMKRRRVI
ncbi:MAG: hypothetical protein Q4F60_02675 [Candidatus Saccharibacteria bacterium]|nr:hypothetical protein [Candidatus Saccharibacteria bacterium]